MSGNRMLILLVCSLLTLAAVARQPDTVPAPDTVPVTRPEPVFEMARLLHEEPWAARIVATISDAKATSSEPIGTPRSDEMFVWYDPEGLVCLSLGMLRVEVRPGSLVAVHARNRATLYEATHDGLSIAEVIRAELPTLWCPWLAIALEGGDPAAWPVVGSHENRLDIATYKPSGVMASGPYSYTSGKMQDASGAVRVHLSFLSLSQQAPRGIYTSTFDDKNIPAPLSWTRNYSISVQTGRTRRTTSFEHAFVLPDSWTPITTDGRQRAASVAELGPPDPQLHAGDRFPVTNLAYPDPESDPDRNAIKTWKPSRAFMYPVPGTSNRPSAIVLAMTRLGPSASDRLAQYSASVEQARRAVAQDQRPIRFAAFPVIATDATEDAIDAFPSLADAWTSQWPPIPEVEDRGRDDAIPVISAGPASLLLDRVAPGADAAIVVVDRSGWITGVIGPEVTGDELVAAIAEAVRSAAR